MEEAYPMQLQTNPMRTETMLTECFVVNRNNECSIMWDITVEMDKH